MDYMDIMHPIDTDKSSMDSSVTFVYITVLFYQVVACVYLLYACKA